LFSGRSVGRHPRGLAAGRRPGSPPVSGASPLWARWIDKVVHARHRRATRAYWNEFGVLPRVALPVSYNEKMFWRRTFDRDPAFVAYCDKLETKSIFQRCDSGLDLAETLWIGTDPADMPASLRRPDVVVKMNAGCDRNWFFRDHAGENAAFLESGRDWLDRPFGVDSIEWGYGQVPPKLFAEATIASDSNGIDEIKVHMFAGEVFYALIYRGEKTPTGLSGIFDAHGRRLRVTNTIVERDPSRALPAEYRVPDCYGRAMEIARRLASGSDYLRVDFMVVDGKLHGGELTPYPSAGLMTNSDPAVLAQMGRCWDLRRSWFLKTPQTGWRALYQAMLRKHVEAMGADPIPILD